MHCGVSVHVRCGPQVAGNHCKIVRTMEHVGFADVGEMSLPEGSDIKVRGRSNSSQDDTAGADRFQTVMKKKEKRRHTGIRVLKVV